MFASFRSNFCNKGPLGLSQFSCLDKSDETVWGCSQVGKNCTGANDLWPCDREDEDAQCIETKKVCDGQVGIELNQCEGQEDEEQTFCRHHQNKNEIG